ncbi:MAG: AAA family ATPase [Bryobacteraceae bacterium]
MDLRYERLYAYLHDDVTRRRPSVDLALNLLSGSREAKIAARGRFGPDSPLIGGRLLHLIPETGTQPILLAHALKLDDSIVRFLLGVSGLDARLRPFTELDAEPEASEPAETDMARILDLVISGSGRLPHLYFEGAAHGAKTTAARTLAARLGTPLFTVDLAKAGGLPTAEFDAALGTLFRDARLQNAVVLLQGFDALRPAERAPQLETLRTALEEASACVIVAGAGACDPRFETLVPVPFGEPGFQARRGAWQSALRKRQVAADARTVDELAARYRLSGLQIQRAVDSAVRQTALQPDGPGHEELAKASRIQLQRDPGSLAQRVRPLYRWEDLVLPPDQIAQLKEVCTQARYRHIVMGDWGFENRLSLGKGLTALFSGPPGTGKTMAVEVIANDLGLDLYKIDLSQVVSKYIGETEKNMDRLFNEAHAGNAILFFDECDALFGKRTAVQDAHDRYANIEIAYLLQKMDEHEGVSILATNLRQNLDAAFTRRLTFIVEFPFPDENSRRRIWQGIWPRKVPRSGDMDLEFMASQFKLPGGAVKNIALAAAYLAAAEDKPEVTTEHLLWATRRELEKSGRSVSRTEFGKYSGRMQEMAASGGRI